MNKELLSLFYEIEDYSNLDVSTKVAMLDKIENLVYENSPIYKFKMKKVSSMNNTYVSLCGKFYNKESGSFYKIKNTRMNKSFKGEKDKVHKALNLYYETFIGNIPNGKYIKSYSNEYEFNVLDLYLSNTSYLEDYLMPNEYYKDFNYSDNLFITSKGRIFSKVNNMFLNKIDTSKANYVTLSGKYYNVLDLVLEHFIENYIKGKYDIIHLDGNRYNIAVENLKIVEDRVEYYMDNFGYKNKNEYRLIFNNKYIITNRGEIFSNINSNIMKLKTYSNKKGYSLIKIKDVSYRIHRLVYSAFNQIDISNYEINHIDSNKLNNSLDNLELVTNQENLIHYKVNSLLGDSTLSFKDILVLAKQIKNLRYVYYSFLSEEQQGNISVKDFAIFKNNIFKILPKELIC